MGAWGSEPWDNDSAADWYIAFFRKTKVAEMVGEMLAGDPRIQYDEMRAAAHVVVALGRNYVWPVERLDADLRRAVEVLTQLRADSPITSDREAVEKMDAEIAALRSRMRRS